MDRRTFTAGLAATAVAMTMPTVVSADVNPKEIEKRLKDAGAKHFGKRFFYAYPELEFDEQDYFLYLETYSIGYANEEDAAAYVELLTTTNEAGAFDKYIKTSEGYNQREPLDFEHAEEAFQLTPLTSSIWPYCIIVFSKGTIVQLWHCQYFFDEDAEAAIPFVQTAAATNVERIADFADDEKSLMETLPWVDDFINGGRSLSLEGERYTSFD